MRSKRLFLFPVIWLVALTFMACAIGGGVGGGLVQPKTALEQYYVVEKSYEGALNILADLAVTGTLTKEVYVAKVQPARKQAEASLDLAWTLIKGQQPADDALIRARNTVATLNLLVQALKGGTK